MTTHRTMPTQSEQFDEKLRKELHRLMLNLQDNALEIRECEKRDDAETASEVLMLVMHRLPIALDAYFACTDRGFHV